jgi:hypothetical protein
VRRATIPIDGATEDADQPTEGGDTMASTQMVRADATALLPLTLILLLMLLAALGIVAHVAAA